MFNLLKDLKAIADAPASAFKHFTDSARHDGVSTKGQPNAATGSASAASFGQSPNYVGFASQPVESIVYSFKVPNGKSLLLTNAVHAFKDANSNGVQSVWLNPNVLAFYQVGGVRVTEAAPLSQILNGDCFLIFPSNSIVELVLVYKQSPPPKGTVELQIRFAGFIAESFVSERLKELQTEF